MTVKLLEQPTPSVSVAVLIGTPPPTNSSVQKPHAGAANMEKSIAFIESPASKDFLLMIVERKLNCT